MGVASTQQAMNVSIGAICWLGLTLVAISYFKRIYLAQNSKKRWCALAAYLWRLMPGLCVWRVCRLRRIRVLGVRLWFSGTCRVQLSIFFWQSSATATQLSALLSPLSQGAAPPAGHQADHHPVGFHGELPNLLSSAIPKGSLRKCLSRTREYEIQALPRQLTFLTANLLPPPSLRMFTHS